MSILMKAPAIQKVPLQVERAQMLPIVAFFVGNTISVVGNVLTQLAIPWFVLETTGSITQTGITAFFATLPMVFSTFFGSTLVDRLGYKRASVVSDIVSSISVMLIPLLYYFARLAFWQLLVLVFLGGLLKSPGNTARLALLPDLARIARIPLERANAFSNGLSHAAGLIGAPLAGILIALIGTGNLLWLDGASFAVSALFIGLAVPVIFVEKKTVEKGQGYMATLWQGVRFIQRDSLILSLIGTILITNMIDSAFFSVIEPAYIKHIFNSAVPFGFLIAASGGAALLGTFLFGLIGHKIPRRITYVIGYTVGGSLNFWVYLLFPVFPLLFAWQIIAGLAIAPVTPIAITVVQERLPDEMRARVFGTVSAGVLIGIPIGTFLSGYAVSWVGLPTSMLIMGAIYLATTLSLLFNPALRQMEKGA